VAAVEVERRSRERPSRSGGTDGNERLTATTAAVLLVLLALEGATILRIQQLISVHVFVGMLLIPPVALKLGSTGYRFARYYAGSLPYRRKGPPPLLLRVLVAPLVVLTTLVLFGTGVALIALGPDRGQGIVLGLHKASFVVWFGAMSVHVLWHARSLPRLVADRLPGRRLRLGVLAAALALGLVLALTTIPLADRWQDGATAAIGLDAR
jgi:hypothetical protein